MTGRKKKAAETPADDQPHRRPQGVPYDYTPPDDQTVTLSVPLPAELSTRLEAVIFHGQNTGWPPGCETKREVTTRAMAMFLDFVEREYGGPWRPPAPGEVRSGRPPAKHRRPGMPRRRKAD